MTRISSPNRTNEFGDSGAIERNCLICEGPTTRAHMSIDACRACSVFYKRFKRGPMVACRNGLFQCDNTIRGNSACRRCRFDRINELLGDGEKEEQKCDTPDSIEERTPSTSAFTPVPRALVRTAREAEFSVIASVRRGHLIMNAIRRASEISMRTSLPDRKGIVADGMTVIPTTYKFFNDNTRILISSMFEFASTSFEEFKTLDHDDKWLLIRNLYPFVMILDSEYRMNKFLPDQETMILLTYGSYIDHDSVSLFFADSPSEKHEVDRTRFVAEYLDGDSRQNRAKMKRWNPSEAEFIAFIGISFWSLDNISVSDSVHRLAEKYRRLLFLELDKMYREEMCVDDYASRMGEAILFIASVQGTVVTLRSKLGVLKLMDDIWEEMILAQLIQ